MCAIVVSTTPASAQLTRDSRYDILRTVIASQAAARIVMPFGTTGVQISEEGTIDQAKLDQEIKKQGASVQEGQVVTVTEITFDDDRIEIELDGGGKKKKSFWERIEVGTGNTTTPVSNRDPAKAKGSKVVVHFEKKVPPELTPDQLKAILDTVLDFNPRNFLKTGIDALPPEYQEAVKAKEARIGMDRSTVLMAMGRPDKRVRERVEGSEREDWIYFQRGLRAQFVSFEDGVVVRIRQF